MNHCAAYGSVAPAGAASDEEEDED